MLSNRYKSSTHNTIRISSITNITFLESCEDGDVRLINDAEEGQAKGCITDSDGKHSVFETAIEGRIEVCFQNVWGAIYDTNFTNLDAAVACHELHYSRHGNVSGSNIHSSQAYRHLKFVTAFSKAQ